MTDLTVKRSNAEIVQNLNERGYNCVPFYAAHSTYSPRVDGQLYPYTDPKWSYATYPAIALAPGMLLIDKDGYKPGCADEAMIADALGLTTAELAKAMVQTSADGASVHWLFRVPVDSGIVSNGEWLPFVDLKLGDRNGLMNIKPGKMEFLPEASQLVPLDLSRMKKPFPRRCAAPVAPVPVVISSATTAAGERALVAICRELAGAGEGERNSALNTAALKAAKHVAAGDIAENHAKADLSFAASQIGLTPNEIEKTIESGFRRGMQEPKPAKLTAAEVFAKTVAAPIVPLAPVVTSFDAVPVPEPVDTGDQGQDALLLHDRIFQGRLARFADGLRWWNGEAWEGACDDMLKRHVLTAMMLGQHGKVSAARVSGTAELLRLTVAPMGEVNPVSQSVFFKNGVLDVTTGAMTQHNRDNRNGFTLGAVYDPSAECKVFKAWLADVFSGELERIDLLQEIIGWLLISDNLNIQKAPIFIGASRGGKGTILELVAKLLGEGQGAFRFQGLNEDKTLASMGDRQVAIDWDAKSPSSKNAVEVCSVFKAVSANEPVAVKLLYTQTTAQRRLNCKMMLAANGIPNLFDDSGASAGRWLPLVFTKSFKGCEDLGLGARLSQELDGIAVWAVEGLRRLMQNGGKFTMPESTRDMCDSMLERGSPLEAFVDEALTLGADYRCADADVFAYYTAWCATSGTEPMKRATFLASLTEVGFSRGFAHKKSVSVNGKFVRGFTGVQPQTVPQNVVKIA